MQPFRAAAAVVQPFKAAAAVVAALQGCGDSRSRDPAVTRVFHVVGRLLRHGAAEVPLTVRRARSMPDVSPPAVARFRPVSTIGTPLQLDVRNRGRRRRRTRGGLSPLTIQQPRARQLKAPVHTDIVKSVFADIAFSHSRYAWRTAHRRHDDDVRLRSVVDGVVGMTWRPPVSRTGPAVSATVNSWNPGRRGTSWDTSHGPVMSMTFCTRGDEKATPIGPGARAAVRRGWRAATGASRRAASKRPPRPRRLREPIDDRQPQYCRLSTRGRICQEVM